VKLFKTIKTQQLNEKKFKTLKDLPHFDGGRLWGDISKENCGFSVF
jgi:hypothetical protein